MRAAVFWLVGALVALPLAWAFSAHLGYEAAGPYNWDTPLYRTVARGWLENGLVPWRDLFESKPPGIFLLCAASRRLTGGPALERVFQLLALLLIAAAPLLVFIANRRARPPGAEGFAGGLACLMGGLALALYAGERAGEVQVESFGAAFGALYVLVLARPAGPGPWRRGLRLAAAAACLLGACGMKEPFLFTLFAAALVLAGDSWRRLLLDFFWPLAAAVLAGLAALRGLGWLDAYFNCYLAEMAGPYFQDFEPAWYRGLAALGRVPADLHRFAWGFALPIGGLFILFVLDRLHRCRGESLSRRLAQDLRLALVLFLPALAVGLGGRFYNHHFVFALPVYLALLARLAAPAGEKPMAAPVRRFALVLLLLGLFGASFFLPRPNYAAKLRDQRLWAEPVPPLAAYVDRVLDETGLTRYLFLGPNGPQPFQHTRHSPAGPLFFQHFTWLAPEREDNREKLRAMLRSARLVVIDWERFGPLTVEFAREIDAYLEENFTGRPWTDELIAIRRSLGITEVFWSWQVLYRRAGP